MGCFAAYRYGFHSLNSRLKHTTMHYLSFGCEHSKWFIGLFQKSDNALIFRAWDSRPKESPIDWAARVYDEAKAADCLHLLLGSEPYRGAIAPVSVLELLKSHHERELQLAAP